MTLALIAVRQEVNNFESLNLFRTIIFSDVSEYSCRSQRIKKITAPWMNDVLVESTPSGMKQTVP